MGTFVKATVHDRNEEHAVLTKKLPAVTDAEKGVLYTNAELQAGGVRNHRAVVSAALSSLPENVRTVRAYGECLLLFCQTGGFYEIYSLKDGVLKKTGVSVTDYPQNSNGSDFCNSMVATEDSDVTIDQGCTHTKLLLFPSKRVMCLGTDGHPTYYTAMPDCVPRFQHATVAKGRLYGSVGQKLYVSGELGCFDWYFDESSGQEKSSSSAWWGNSMTVSEGGLPITALVSYKDGVLVFRENAMQMIKGDVTPFVVKDLYKTGTSSGKSVREVEGILYFISKNRVARYNGSSLTFLPPLPEGTVLPGPAGIFEDKYCFYGERDGDRYIYTYHADLDGYSVVKIGKAIRDFIICGKKLYFLVGEPGEADPLYLLSDNRVPMQMQAEIPIETGDLGDFSIERVTVEGETIEDTVIEVQAELTDKKGTKKTFDVFTLYAEKGKERIYRAKTRLPFACKGKLKIYCRGDALLKGYRIRYKKREGSVDQ